MSNQVTYYLVLHLDDGYGANVGEFETLRHANENVEYLMSVHDNIEAVSVHRVNTDLTVDVVSKTDRAAA